MALVDEVEKTMKQNRLFKKEILSPCRRKGRAVTSTVRVFKEQGLLSMEI